MNTLPTEILTSILGRVAVLHEREGQAFTYGLSPFSASGNASTKLQRYIRGATPPDAQRFNSVASIRRVCWAWHEWAVAYALKDVYIRKWKANQRWAELPSRPEQYSLYELVSPQGAAVLRDPDSDLKVTTRMLCGNVGVATKIQRLWFDGFYDAASDRCIFAALKSCPNLRSATLPWTTLRHIRADEWAEVLQGTDGVGLPRLTSLEFMSVDLPAAQNKIPDNWLNLLRPLADPRVSFGALTRLKIIGNARFMPIDDEDLIAIARTATSLEEFHITNTSTITIEGVIAIVKASRATLRVLEHAPRGDDGFSHPYPGAAAPSEHVCALLRSCPNLRDVSISTPAMCADLFADPTVAWAGECQVRAARLCPSSSTNEPDQATQLAHVLEAARALTARLLPRRLAVELFFAGCVFDPTPGVVHGAFVPGAAADLADFNDFNDFNDFDDDFDEDEVDEDGETVVAAAAAAAAAAVSSYGFASDFPPGRLAWPASYEPSSKGPYGSTGLYGKEHGGVWQRVSEAEFFDGARRGFVDLAAGWS